MREGQKHNAENKNQPIIVYIMFVGEDVLKNAKIGC